MIDSENVLSSGLSKTALDSEIRERAMTATAPKPIPNPIVDLSFPHRWQAEVLAARPLILPPRHFVYPQAAEEVERGALEVLIRPDASGVQPADAEPQATGPFLATCALGFRDPAVPTGLWSTPRPEEICAVAGGYAYLIDATAPERFTMIPYRPVLEIRAAVAEGLLLFIGHRSILAFGPDGQAWESEKLSDEGVTIAGIDGGVLHGTGWELRSNREKEFVLDLRTGQPRQSAADVQ
ncbi:MAG TPA: hypothetical protein VGG45_01700 [Terracidiphilus sp.]|jgi:hypothetical protein